MEPEDGRRLLLLGLPSQGRLSVRSVLSVAEAFELREGARAAPLFVTCEHASERLPSAWSWPESDRRLLGTHWAYDLGARELALELAHALDASAVLSRCCASLARRASPPASLSVQGQGQGQARQGKQPSQARGEQEEA